MTEPVRFDWEREARTAIPEVVFAQGKRADQIAAIVEQAHQRSHTLLITRLSETLHEHLLSALTASQLDLAIDYDAVSQTAVVGSVRTVEPGPSVGIVCAGTSDLPVALEAQRTLTFMGRPSVLYADVGVAGLWRLMSIVDQLAEHRVLIAVAGMEGALFSVLGGLVPGVVIAVPTSVGYGVASGGRAALSSALASCSPGIVCVNIDNGFGAAGAAHKMLPSN